MSVRAAALAGRWYPASADACAQQLDATPAPDATDLPAQAWGAIVPHAGWVYSGATAFAALRELHARQPDPDLIVVFGGHLGPRDEPRLMVSGGWQTPFGPAAIDEGLAQDVAMALSCDLETAESFYEDNAVEVQMPMITRLWPDRPVLTLGVPPIRRAASMGREVVDLARRRGFERIVVIGSTDLTHYGPNYDYQPQGRGFSGLQWVKTVNDPAVIAPMVGLDPSAVLWTAERDHNACCPGAIMAALCGAKALGASRGALTGYTTSWDVRSDGELPTSFVGYAGLLLGA